MKAIEKKSNKQLSRDFFYYLKELINNVDIDKECVICKRPYENNAIEDELRKVLL